MPNSWPSTPLRRSITPSTRQCAGNGPIPGAPGYGGGTVVPAGTSAALVILVPSTRQCAGNGPIPGAPGYGGGTVVPAGTSAALVILVPSILRSARAAHRSEE